MLLRSAKEPMAVLKLPVVLFSSAKAPKALLESPLELLTALAVPVAVFSVPGGVQQKRCSASSRIRICGVER